MIKALTINSLFGMLAAVAVMAFSCPKAHAHTHHSANVCSQTAQDICAHIGYDDINSTNAASFMLHFMPKAVDPALVTDVKVKLTMDMGGHAHGSSPVTLVRRDAAHIEVSDAYFPMAGQWDIQVGFTYASGTHQIIIPVDVK